MLRKMSLFFLVLATAGFVLAAEPNPRDIKVSKGDPVAGQKVFAAMKCNACHYVAGEEGQKYDNPVSTAPAPLLDFKLAAQSPKDVATSIVAPSHTVSSAITEQSGGKLSPMASYAGLLDERQLSDLVAYLQSFQAEKPKW
ncbi:MAG TPA: cytochrome c [Thermoanaerobaculia bacterium]|nr:cytochrome c [Thermoanaerobaculia bacterium]